MLDSSLAYQTGMCNEFATEALPGALPKGRNSPQKAPYGLYAEQLSGTAFTAPRHANRRTWLYRIRPSTLHQPFVPINSGRWINRSEAGPATPNQLRWEPLPLPTQPTDFIDGMTTMAVNSACAVHLYAANRSMETRFFYDADAELLIVPQQGCLELATEMGRLQIEPQEIAVIPRGVRFQVRLMDPQARGYVCENFGAALKMPDLGVIGSNGLANPRDFATPIAAFEDREGDFELIARFQDSLWSASIGHSPLDVVAWHGNHAPYKYDLRRFNTIGSISYDHPDPSIFLVLHSVSDTPGVDTIDFVIFPPRVLVAKDTFRPPWYHRNIASEFMGLIHGAYDAKADGFVPGGASLHNCMSAHGPDAETFAKASAADTTCPDYLSETMAFMFESNQAFRPTPFAMETAQLQHDYFHCWQGLKKHFNSAQA